jgi:hypothetical protein
MAHRVIFIQMRSISTAVADTVLIGMLKINSAICGTSFLWLSNPQYGDSQPYNCNELHCSSPLGAKDWIVSLTRDVGIEDIDAPS